MLRREAPEIPGMYLVTVQYEAIIVLHSSRVHESAAARWYICREVRMNACHASARISTVFLTTVAHTHTHRASSIQCREMHDESSLLPGYGVVHTYSDGEGVKLHSTPDTIIGNMHMKSIRSSIPYSCIISLNLNHWEFRPVREGLVRGIWCKKLTPLP
jgi:hypothetical protein